MFKKNESLRLCVNYKELNKVIIKNRHSLSLISEILNRLNKTMKYIKLNFKDAYYRIRIQKNDK